MKKIGTIIAVVTGAAIVLITILTVTKPKMISVKPMDPDGNEIEF